MAPYLSSVNYRDWYVMQEHVYRRPIGLLDVSDLKLRLIAARADLLQRVIHKAIDKWRGWLRACVDTDGQCGKHLL